MITATSKRTFLSSCCCVSRLCASKAPAFSALRLRSLRPFGNKAPRPLFLPQSRPRPPITTKPEENVPQAFSVSSASASGPHTRSPRYLCGSGKQNSAPSAFFPQTAPERRPPSYRDPRRELPQAFSVSSALRQNPIRVLRVIYATSALKTSDRCSPPQ
jgi:hypothetical protein